MTFEDKCARWMWNGHRARCRALSRGYFILSFTLEEWRQFRLLPSFGLKISEISRIRKLIRWIERELFHRRYDVIGSRQYYVDGSFPENRPVRIALRNAKYRLQHSIHWS